MSWLVGHAVLVRRSVYEEVGGFDEKYRCAAEDWDISQRIRALGYSLVHVPSLIAESHELASIDRLARKNVRNAGWDIRENGMQYPCAALHAGPAVAGDGLNLPASGTGNCAEPCPAAAATSASRCRGRGSQHNSRVEGCEPEPVRGRVSSLTYRKAPTLRR